MFVVLTPDEPPEEHLRQLAEVARLVSDRSRLDALREASSVDEVLELLAPSG